MNAERKFFRIEPDECELTTGERIFIHLFRPEDAPGIGKLFQAVYGDGYPVKRFYNPEELAEALEKEENYSVVARTQSGDIIGHMGLFRSAPFAGLYETGGGLVLPEYRKAGINILMLDHVYQRLVPSLGLEETWGEAVCNHVFMQKTVARQKHVETRAGGRFDAGRDLRQGKELIGPSGLPARISVLCLQAAYGLSASGL